MGKIKFTLQNVVVYQTKWNYPNANTRKLNIFSLIYFVFFISPKAFSSYKFTRVKRTTARAILTREIFPLTTKNR